MKKLLKILIGIIALLSVIFLIVFALAKAKIVYINKWFVNEKQSIIGVDISSYQADVDMNILKNQNIEFVYIKVSEGSSHQDEYFKDNWNNAKKAGLVSGAYHFFSYDSPGITQAQNEKISREGYCLLWMLNIMGIRKSILLRSKTS